MLVEGKKPSDLRKIAYLGILLLGTVSLTGDVVYEGARGVLPDFLMFLGANLAIVSLVSGLSDFLGYVMRLVGGYFADKTRAYWFFIFIGYGLIVALPLLGSLGMFGLEAAVILVLLERMGKALRSPSRDAVLSIVSKGVGAGKAFGLHELLDQVGAIIGPSLVATLMFISANNYSFTFTLLFIPFSILLVVLTYAYRKIGKTAITEKRKTGKKSFLEKQFYIYTLAVLLNTMGLIPYSVILGKASSILKPLGGQWIIPIMYMFIQAVDALAAPISGYAYDKFKTRILVAPFLLSIIPSLLPFINTNLSLLWVAAAFFGFILGMHESIYRAAISDFTSIASRGTAYGIFNAAYGLGFLISGSLYGLLMALEAPFTLLACYIIVIQISAVILLLKVWRTKH